MAKGGITNFCLICCLLLSCQLMRPVFTEDEAQEEVLQEEVPMLTEEATKDSFADLVKNNPYSLVLFYEAGCDDCETAKKVMGDIIKPDMFPSGLKKVQISDGTVAGQFGVEIFPSFVLMRQGSENPVIYDGENVDVQSIESWLDVAHEVATKTLTDDSFEHLTQASTGSTTGDWLVAFYKSSCPSVLSTMESLGVRVRRKMNVAKIDMEASPKLVKRLKVEKCPTLIFFRQGKMYRYEVEKYDTKSLTSFVEGWYKNMKAENVPRESTGFFTGGTLSRQLPSDLSDLAGVSVAGDELTEGIAQALKEQLQGPKRTMFLAVTGGVVFLVVLVLFCACFMSRKNSAQKKKLY